MDALNSNLHYLSIAKGIQKMDLETLHISQLYECVAVLCVFVLLVTEFLVGYNKLWGHIMQISLKEQEEEMTWIRT